jgi:hypothetical protein
VCQGGHGALHRDGIHRRRFDEGISERKLALELDPLSTTAIFELGENYLFARNYVQFQRSCRGFRDQLAKVYLFFAASQ